MRPIFAGVDRCADRVGNASRAPVLVLSDPLVEAYLCTAYRRPPRDASRESPL